MIICTAFISTAKTTASVTREAWILRIMHALAEMGEIVIVTSSDQDAVLIHG